MEPTEPTGEDPTKQEQPTNQSVGKRESGKTSGTNRRGFFKFTAGLGALAGLSFLESHKDHSASGYDPEISKALEKEGIKHVHHRMLFGDHFLNNSTFSKIEQSQADIITGEIHIDGIPDEYPYKPPVKIIDTPFGKEFLSHLLSFGGSGVSSSDNFFGIPWQADKYNWMNIFEQNYTIASADGIQEVTQADSLMEASATANSVRNKFQLGLLATTLALDLKLAGLLDLPMNRRRFMKLSGVLAGITTTAGGYKALDALYKTTIGQQYIEAPANTEVTGIYSKFDSLSDDAEELILQLQNDKDLAIQFSRITRLRNQSMALNLWYLSALFEKNPNLRTAVCKDENNVNILSMAGSGHSALKDYFCKGPRELEQSLTASINYLGQQYLKDIDEKPDNTDNITDFYADIFGTFSSPRIKRKSGISFNNDGLESNVQTPQYIAYKYFIETLQNETNPEKKKVVEKLFGEILKRQIAIDIPKDDITTFAGLERNTYKPIDTETLSRRIIQSGTIPGNANKTNTQFELHDNVASIQYKHNDDRSVGILFVNSIPFPFFQKETIPSFAK